MNDINKVNQTCVIHFLHCLTVAIWPLRFEELSEVLAVDFDVAQ
jgi:hypothetical protein